MLQAGLNNYCGLQAGEKPSPRPRPGPARPCPLGTTLPTPWQQRRPPGQDTSRRARLSATPHPAAAEAELLPLWAESWARPRAWGWRWRAAAAGGAKVRGRGAAGGACRRWGARARCRPAFPDLPGCGVLGRGPLQKGAGQICSRVRVSTHGLPCCARRELPWLRRPLWSLGRSEPFGRLPAGSTAPQRPPRGRGAKGST